MLRLKCCDVFEETGDALICPANVQLNLSGGVSGEILRRGGTALQAELHDHLKRRGASYVVPGTVVATSAAPLPYRQMLHAVAIDAFYESDIETVARTIENAWRLADQLQLSKVVMCAIATGYGRMSLHDFGLALQQAVANTSDLELDILLVLKTTDDLESVRDASQLTFS